MTIKELLERQQKPTMEGKRRILRNLVVLDKCDKLVLSDKVTKDMLEQFEDLGLQADGYHLKWLRNGLCEFEDVMSELALSGVVQEAYTTDMLDQIYYTLTDELESDANADDLVTWLASDSRRLAHVTNILKENEVTDGLRLLQMAQVEEMRAIYGICLYFIEWFFDVKDDELNKE